MNYMKNDIQVGDIVQVIPGTGSGDWDGCLVIVDEIKSFGIQGYTKIPCSGDAFIRLKFEEIERVGRAVFVRPE